MKTKNYNLICYYVIFACLFLLFNFKSYAQLYRYNGEIMGEVIGLEGWDEWRVNAQCISLCRWEIVNGECYLTNNHGTAYIEGFGSSMSTFGFHNPGGHEGKNYDIAFGNYRFTFDLPGSNDDTSFILDLRDADWTGNYSSPYDITIRWDIENRKLKYRIGGAGNPYYDLDEDTIWDILGEASPNKAALQPTPPLYFRCTNANQDGQHPNFSWSKPSEPDIASSNFKYEIYRRVDFSGSFNRIAYNITNTTWTDNEVIIDRDKTNSLFTYYATAYTNQSPISERSDYASVIGNACSKPLSEYPEEDKNENQLKNNNLFACPNPFNPSTSIYYSIPTNGGVLISIYNIKGQKIIELINFEKQAGKHSISFNGHSIAGGIYFVRLQFNNQILTKKILLFK